MQSSLDNDKSMADVERMLRAHGIKADVIEGFDGIREPTVVLHNQHFTCYWPEGDRLRYFDPYGSPPPVQGPWIVERAGVQSDFVWNNEVRDIQTCGRHVVYRLKHKDLGEDEYRALLGPYPDVTVLRKT